MTPADAKTVRDFLVATWDFEVLTTTRVFQAVPDERLDYRPDPVSKTAIDLIRHIALEDVWFLDGIADGRFGPMPDQGDGCGLSKPADAAAQYPSRAKASLARVKALSGEELLREIDLMGAFKFPAIQFLSLALRHSTHHRGQLSSYLRAMGGKVPSIYGPSADTVQLTA